MSFEAAVEAGAPALTKGPDCSVKVVLAWLPSDRERHLLKAMICDPEWRNTAIINAYVTNFVEKRDDKGEIAFPRAPRLGDGAVGRHRRKVYAMGRSSSVCSCLPESPTAL